MGKKCLREVQVEAGGDATCLEVNWKVGEREGRREGKREMSVNPVKT